jgi:transposase
MPKRLSVHLSQAQADELRQTRDHHPKAYMREKAAAILKLAQEHLPATEVAAHRLLKRRDDNTVRAWLKRYLEAGLNGLRVQAGRGRRPAFAPKRQAESSSDDQPTEAVPDAKQVAAEVQEMLHQLPTFFGIDRHTWTLESIRSCIGWMQSLSLPGVCRLLRRWKIVYKRGRAHVHSPDPAYRSKLAAIWQAREEAAQAPAEVVFLYEDEFTAFLRPLVGRSYRAQSEPGQKATGATGEAVRLAACVDVSDGRVTWRRRGSYTVKEMYRYFSFVQKQYPQARVIYIALDNWPVHFHAYVQEHLDKLQSRIRLLPLPTYAPWTNPTEKYWLKLSREWLRFHPYAGDKRAFIQALEGWLRRHSDPSPQLLHELGLLPV